MKIADYILLAIIAALFIAAVVRTVRRGACPCGTCNSYSACKTDKRKSAHSGCAECSKTNGVGCAECRNTLCGNCTECRKSDSAKTTGKCCECKKKIN